MIIWPDSSDSFNISTIINTGILMTVSDNPADELPNIDIKVESDSTTTFAPFQSKKVNKAIASQCLTSKL